MGGINMKVLIINGSPRANSNTSIALHEMEKIFSAEGIETEIIQIVNVNEYLSQVLANI